MCAAVYQAVLVADTQLYKRLCLTVSPSVMMELESVNRSPKGKMWSAIPFALLCMVENLNERQGSGPKGDKVL